MRGRRPAGTEVVDRQQGSTTAKERLKAVLDTIAGNCRVEEACRRLQISTQRFRQLREEILAAALAGAEPGKPGRPAKIVTPADEEIRALQQQLAAQDLELRAAQARAEIALTLPRVVHPPVVATPVVEKKNARPAAPSPLCPPGEGSGVRGPSAWDEEEHVKRLQQLCRSSVPDLGAFGRRSSARRSSARQWSQRQCEHILRSSIVHLADWTIEQGWTLPQTAERLHLAPRTLRQWQHDLHNAALQVHAVGRPLLRSSRHERNDVIALLHELGPRTGVPTLQACFPTMPRVELADLVRRYRRLWRRQHTQLLHTLRWTTPGAVWAMDFAETPTPIDGKHLYLLAVRDLASGRQLLWLPTSAPTADVAVRALRGLFAWYGSPLVLKTDNGSAFCAEAMLDLLHEKEVLPLFSPPRTPRYNGAIEAGIGSLKTRTETHATRQGHPGHWTADDVAAAQAEANATARPQGPAGPTPDERWAQRPALTLAQRLLFRDAVDRCRSEARMEEGLSTDGPLTTHVERTIDRRAIRRALVEQGYLLFRRRRIPLPFSNQKMAEIT